METNYSKLNKGDIFVFDKEECNNLYHRRAVFEKYDDYLATPIKDRDCPVVLAEDTQVFKLN